MSVIDNVRERVWPKILDNLSLASPYEVDFQDESLTSDAWLAPLASELSQVNHDIFSAPGKDATYIRDAAFMFVKAEGVASIANRNLREGRGTWSIVDVHHATIFYTKAVCGFFGVHVNAVKGQSYVIDYFPENGPKDYRTTFKRENRDRVEPIRLMKWKTALVEQKHIWEIFKRVAVVCSMGDDRNSYLQSILSRDIGKHSPERNKILYGLGHWTFMNDIFYASSEVLFRRGLFDMDLASFDFETDILIFEEIQALARTMCGDVCRAIGLAEKNIGSLYQTLPTCLRCS